MQNRNYYILPLMALLTIGLEVKTMEQVSRTIPTYEEAFEKGTVFIQDVIGFGKRATLDQNGVIQVWDSSTGELVGTWRRYKGEKVNSLSFSAGGTQLNIDMPHPTGTVKIDLGGQSLFTPKYTPSEKFKVTERKT